MLRVDEGALSEALLPSRLTTARGTLTDSLRALAVRLSGGLPPPHRRALVWDD
jgi:hypothetical protein